MKTLKMAFALVVVLALGGAAEAAPPQCSAACKTTSDCSQPCTINHDPTHQCGDIHVCDPKKKLTRFEERLEKAPSQPRMKEVLSETAKS